MLKFWNQTLENLLKDQRKDKFKIIVNNIIYDVPFSYALGISPLITENHLKDPTFHQLIINIDENNNIETAKIKEEFSKFTRGEEISKEIFYEIGNCLKNKEMIKIWKQSQKLTKEIIIKSIKANHKIYDNNKENIKEEIENIEEELKYFGEHIEEMKEEIKELKDEELIFILNNEQTKVEKEDLIWEIVKERIKNRNTNKENKKDNINQSILLGSIEAKYLNKKSFKEFIEMINEDDIEREKKLLNNIKEILINNIDNIQINGQLEGNNFNGLINYLQMQYGN